MTDDDHPADRTKPDSLAARLRGRDDSEHEQILIRIGFGFLALVYIVASTEFAGGPGPHALLGLGIVSGHFIGGLLLFAHLLHAPRTNVVRRCLGMALDIVALTAILWWGGEKTALFYPLYLWVTLGMGFRYGLPYLFASAALTMAGFAIVILFTPSWQTHLSLTLSLWAALIVLPAYTSSLIRKLTHALHRAEEANRAKGRFLATMSHELRTPLHAIIGMSEMLEVRRLDTEQRQMVETVHSAGQTLLEMIEDILDVARIESGRVVDDVGEFDLHVVLSAARCLLHKQARTKGIDLHLEIDPALPYRLEGVSRWVKQILINLIGNAIKFTDRGHVVIRAGFEPIDANEIRLRIDVEDTGIGMSADVTDRIFDQFVQADESTTRLYGGTGLGLSIARQFAERMGGRLTVTSEEDKGSCFRFEAPFRLSPAEDRTPLDGRVLVIGDVDGRYGRLLPAWGVDPVLAEGWSDALGILDSGILFRALLLIDPEGDRHHPQFEARLAGNPFLEPIDVITIGRSEPPDDWRCLAKLNESDHEDALYHALHAALAMPTTQAGASRPFVEEIRVQPRRILVAEDNRINQRVIEKMLRLGGHSVEIVSDGEQLLDGLNEAKEPFDLVLVDLNMPTMNGLDALKLHRMASGDDHPPFVALTADATADSRERCLEAGMAAYMTKPVDLHGLLHTIDRLTAAGGKAEAEALYRDNVVRHPRFSAPRQILDLTHIECLRDLEQNDNFFNDVIADFIDDADMLIDELERAAMADDSLAFRERAHALRSSAAHMGALGLRDLCLSWRDFGPNELAVRGEREIKLLRAEFDRLRNALIALTTEGKAADVDRGSV